MTLSKLATLAGTALILQTWVSAAAAQSTDFEFYKAHVEPIFLKHRPTHGRCVTCHAGNGGGFVLQPLSPGSATWTEEQSRLNFAAASELVSPGNPTSSHLLMHPLAPNAGGDLFHSGGHQFASQNDPDWLEMAAWVSKKPPAEYANLKMLKAGDNVMEVMQTFNMALRCDCTFCHTAPDFASDRKPTKATARRMIQITQGLEASLGQGKATCYTCHRGERTPQTFHPQFPDLKPVY
jgi:hypothetical protein